MAKQCTLMGPDEDVLSVADVAKLFGYRLRPFRRLIATGYFPAPRGFGHAQFYTGLDVAIIREMLGRWMPQAEPADPDDADDEPPHKPAPKRTNSA
jgi:hypothetical protein